MTLTTRGRIVAGIVAIGLLWGIAFGVQALNAVVLPGAIALLAGWLLVRRTGEPQVDRMPVDPGMASEERTVRLDVSHDGALTVEVEDAIPADVRATDARQRRPAVDGRVVYTIVAERRGVRALGPVRVRVRGPFGLFERIFENDLRTEVLTYPPLRDVAWWATDPLLLPEGARTRERHEFDQLREYDPADALRDIHWRSSAKRPDGELIVKEFVSETEAGTVRIAAECDPGRADDMASAAASLAVRILEAGIAVGLETRDGSVPVAAGPSHRRRLLGALARTGGGRLDQKVIRGAPIVVRVRAEDQGVSVHVGDRTLGFDELTRRRTVATDGGQGP